MTQKKYCQKCNKELVGNTRLESGQFGHINVVVFVDSPDKNWIQCSECNKEICKSCCQNPDLSYCDKCVKKVNIIPINRRTKI